MSGIAALYHYDSERYVSDSELRDIRDHMHARGPDDAQLWIDPDRRLGLAHQRLAVIDLTPTGTQPMVSKDGRFAVVFDGSIYNYRALRAELSDLDHPFLGQSDTEVLLHGYRQWGRSVVERLEGMYAFALWDSANRELFLARDPFGIKPLYYHDDGKVFRVASQVRALLAGGGIEDSLEPAGLVGFYLWGSVPEPFTLTRNLFSLPPGHTLTVCAAGAGAPRRYFDVRGHLMDASEAVHPDSEEVRDTLNEAVTASVRKHMSADVPVSVLLSASVDSSAVAALAAQELYSGRVRNTQQSLTAVTLGFKQYTETVFDEVPFARMTARQFGLSHRTVLVSKSDFDRERFALLGAMDLPSIDGVNCWLLARAVSRSGFKVALCSVGADALLGGYGTFKRIPALVRGMGPLSAVPGFGSTVRWLSASLISRYASPKYAGLFEYGGSYGGAYLLRRALYMPWELPRLMDPELVKEGWARLQPVLRADEWVRPIRGSRARVASLELNLYLRNMLLRDWDWAATAHSLEVRMPLLDVRLFRAIAGLVAARNPPSKVMLATSPRTPMRREVMQRAKSGFTSPIHRWMSDVGIKQHGLRGWANYVLAAYGVGSADRARKIQTSDVLDVA